jgi:diguanylate cyclase (GGDEF)-like protein
VTGRLEKCVGVGGTVFRLGGDEFAVILPRPDAGTPTALAAEILARLHDPLVIEDRMLNTGATIGIVLFPSHGKSPAEILQNADLALYEGKRRGRNQADPPSRRSTRECN